MSLDWAQLLLTLGVGGVVGAGASAFVSFKRVSSALGQFRAKLTKYIESAPAGSEEVRAAFEELEASVREFSDRFAKLRSAIGRK